MKYAKVESIDSVDTVTGVVVATEAIGDYTTEVNDDVGIGWTSDGAGGFNPPVVTPPDPTMVDCFDAAQKLLDQQALSMGYDSIISATTYADEPAVPSYQTEGQVLRAWRSNVWAAAIVINDEVIAETRPQPTVAEFLTEMPAYE